jgi:hypothetical protein
MAGRVKNKFHIKWDWVDEKTYSIEQSREIMIVSNDLKGALDEVSASSAGGAPFLIAYGATFLITAILSFFVARETAAMVAMFQGGVALPVAFWLERRMGSRRMAKDNPLQALSVQMAMSQALGLPILILAYSMNPRSVPMVLAALGGVHFLPYAWLHRTRLYVFLGVALSLGAFAIQIVLGPNSFSYILLYVTLIYWITAPLVYHHAARMVKEAGGGG